MSYIVVFITTSNQKEAEKIADVLVVKKLAACVNIIPHINSIYRWQNKIAKSREILLVVKSKKNLFRELVMEVKKNHSYTVPEVIVIDIVKGYKPYLEWWGNSVKPR